MEFWWNQDGIVMEMMIKSEMEKGNSPASSELIEWLVWNFDGIKMEFWWNQDGIVMAMMIKSEMEKGNGSASASN